MIKITTTERTDYWECGDGCCSNWTSYYTVFFDGKEVVSDLEARDVTDAVIFSLKKSGIADFPDHEFTLVANEEAYSNL